MAADDLEDRISKLLLDAATEKDGKRLNEIMQEVRRLMDERAEKEKAPSRSAGCRAEIVSEKNEGE
jgi:hypothetical protein